MISRGETVMRDFVEQVCIGYSSLLRTQASSYQKQPNVVPADSRARGQYLVGYRARLDECAQALHVGEADRDEERVGSTPRPHDDGNIVEVPPPAKSTYLIV